MPSHKLKVFDLFSGIGGFSKGLEQTGLFETVGFCEIEPYCQQVIKKHWPHVKIFDDIKSLSNKTPELSGIDVLCGGFPCQDISIAGKGKGITGERSGLWQEYKRVINEVRPKYAIIENVSALLGRGLETVLQDLAEIGYDATYTTFDSQFFGVPQRRRRVYILAVRDGILPESDIFELGKRDSEQLGREMAAIKEGSEWNFTQRDRKQYSFAYFTRQRSDQYSCCGVSGTLAKRDYKSYTDLVVDNHGVRRVTPQERMLLQGLPADWLDGCGLTNMQMFLCNGMTVPVVSYIGNRLYEYNQTARI
jgi:DNA-cytosine methyltransferase